MSDLTRPIPAAAEPSPWRRLPARLGRVAMTVRANDWWENKAACLLGTAYALAYACHVSVAALWPMLGLILASFVPGAAYVCVVNDVTDMADDLRAGKPNRLAGRSRAFRAAALSLCLLAGAAAGWAYRAYPVTLVIYAANWVAFTLYSVPPFRLKVRGVWGVIADACGGQFLPTLWIASYITEASGHAFDPHLFVPLGCWALALGLRGILGHQLRDFENDRRAGVGTLVTRLGQNPVRRFVARKIYPVMIGALLCVLGRIDAPLTWYVVAFYLLVEAQRPGGPKPAAHWLAPLPELWWPPAEYYKFYYPLTFTLALAWREPAALALVAAQLVLFPMSRQQAFRDMGGLFRSR